LRRIANARKASPLYASLGPQIDVPGDVYDELRAEFEAWHEEHYEAWRAGEAVPEPPGFELYDSYAKPAGWAA
jgi:hypothetical protein